MSWSVFDATDITITPGTGSLPLSGSVKVHPTQTTTYTLKASNKHGSTRATTVVSVETNNVPANVPVIKSFQAGSGKILSGENAALSWSVSGATSVKITPEVGNVQSDGSALVNPAQTTIYILTATNEAGNSKATAIVSVDKNVDLPTIGSFSSSPEEIVYGQSSILSWNVSGATSVIITPGIGDVSLSGSRTVYSTKNTAYTIIAANKAGSVKATSFVSVEKINLPTIESFNTSSGEFIREEILH